MSKSTVSQYDMGYTPAEFSQVLKGNFTGEKSELSCESVSTNQWLIKHQDSAMSIAIQIEKKPDRILGAIALPVLSVSFKVNSATTEQSKFFFEKFFKYFHKGGG
ncbi:MAG: hypothetical protein GY744_20525 [Gammaproteobacteria bacterium]|nr:hypothetical protein [Gammaproteobacteria bacterium]